MISPCNVNNIQAFKSERRFISENDLFHSLVGQIQNSLHKLSDQEWSKSIEPPCLKISMNDHMDDFLVGRIPSQKPLKYDHLTKEVSTTL
jgi:hypothetical protein